jgi:hypothetical protein
MDDEIYADFRAEFPDIPVDALEEMRDFKCDEAKAKWRPWIMKYEKTVDEYNFGTLLRIKADGDYTEENTMFGAFWKQCDLLNLCDAATRMQFYAIEIARNREGANKPRGQ